MKAIEIHDVHKTYRRGGLFGRGRVIHAVAGVRLTISKGKCLALAGPSGSGKSTLGRLVLGLEEPDSGTIRYDGRTWADATREQRLDMRRNVQAVFQNSHGAVNPRFTAKDIVAEPLINFRRLAGSALDDCVADNLRQVGLDPADMLKRPHQFSGGELQRICLARALAPEPEVVVLDEAVSSLDMVNQSRVLSILRRLREKSGTTFLFITHDMRVVASIADAMAVMDNGKIVHYTESLDTARAPEVFEKVPVYKELIDAVLPAVP